MQEARVLGMCGKIEIKNLENRSSPKTGPNGETINFKRGGTPIQENLPRPPGGENTLGQSPLHNRANPC